MNLVRILLIVCCYALIVLFSPGQPAQEADKLIYADFETAKDNRPVTNRDGQIQLISYQERATLPSKFKGQAGTTPPAPELVRLSKDNPNKAATFEYELQATNEYAGVGLDIQGQADKDGKPAPDDVSKYKFLTMQLYVTGVQSITVEFISRGQGIEISSGHPRLTFKVTPGLNTYRVPLNSLAQPSWAQTKVNPKDVLKKLTAVDIVASCGQCTQTKGVVVIDNLVFQN